ncbi:MAG: hypothetical protein ABJB40_13495, partial [Acidobacteriota bacterium]
MPSLCATRFVLATLGVLFVFTLVSAPAMLAQSKPQKVEPNPDTGKRNQRPVPMTEEEKKKAEEEKKRKEEEKNAVVDPTVEKVESNIVNVDTVVYNKKTGQIVSGLKKEDFAIFENGVKQNISNFA